jgi:hypothetical protein
LYIQPSTPAWVLSYRLVLIISTTVIIIMTPFIVFSHKIASDIFIFLIAQLSVGWGFILIVVLFKSVVEMVQLWASFKNLSKFTRKPHGAPRVAPIYFLYLFKIMSDSQTRMLFN